MPGGERGLLAVADWPVVDAADLIDEDAEAELGRHDRGRDGAAPLPRRGGREAGARIRGSPCRRGLRRDCIDAHGPACPLRAGSTRLPPTATSLATVADPRRRRAGAAVRGVRPGGGRAPAREAGAPTLRKRDRARSRRSSPTSSSSRRRPPAVVEEERAQAGRVPRGARAARAVNFRAGRGVPARARAVRDAVRARPHAPADDRARHAAAALRVDPRGRDRTASRRPCASCAAILERHGLRTGQLHVAAPALVPRADRGGRAAGRRRPTSPPPCARGAQAAELVNRTADRGRPRDAVRGAHRRRLPRARPARGGGGGDRGRPRRPLRRHQRDPLEGAGADARRASSTRAGSGRRSRTSPREKLAVVRDHATLVVGPAGPRGAAVAARVAAERHATLIARARRRRHSAARARRLPAARTSRWRAAAAEAFLGRPLRRPARRGARPPRPRCRAGSSSWPSDPLTSPRRRPQPAGAGAGRVAARGDRRAPPARGRDRRARGQGRRRDARDAAARTSTRCVFTRPANPRSLSPATLVTLAEKLGGPPAETVAGPARRAGARARAGRAGRRGARHRLDLPDRGPRARGCGRAGVDAVRAARDVRRSSFDLDGVLVDVAGSRHGARAGSRGLRRNGIDEARASVGHARRSFGATVVPCRCGRTWMPRPRPRRDRAAARRRTPRVCVLIPGAAGGAPGIEAADRRCCGDLAVRGRSRLRDSSCRGHRAALR